MKSSSYSQCIQILITYTNHIKLLSQTRGPMEEGGKEAQVV